MKIILLQGDITRQDVDVIVNAANGSLTGGGGVDGAIHRAAGPGLLEECRQLGGCPTGEAKITAGHNLQARYVIHAVGPVWQEGLRGEDEMLASCYRRCFEIAVKRDLVSLAFPAISTGAYRFPLERATRIAKAEAERMMINPCGIGEVRFICFDEKTLAVYRRVFADMMEE